jgi:RNA polymerase sigma factor (TIGR02999 family)
LGVDRPVEEVSRVSHPSDQGDNLTVLLNAAADGDSDALQQAMATIYKELRAIAQVRMTNERAGHTLQATALVNEAYLRLLGRQGTKWEGRRHFFRAAAEAMRKILIDHARARNAVKRGGGAEGQSGARAALAISSVADMNSESDPEGILALDGAIVRLEGVDAQAAAVVRLRFYAGLNEQSVAEALEVSERTVRRTWVFARGWLRDAIEQESR